MTTAAATATAAIEARRSGDFLRCYDLAVRGLDQDPGDLKLAWLSVMALADLGNIETAVEQYERYPAAVSDAAVAEDWLALRGRLYKELALRHAEGAQQNFRRAADAYHAAYRATGKTYSAINAATMFLLCGDGEQACSLAQRVSQDLNGAPPQDDAGAYYHCATLAEALLILADADGAAAALALANSHLQRDATTRSRTLRQLRLICDCNGLPPALLDALRVPGFICVLPGVAADAVMPHRAASVFAVPGVAAEIEMAERLKADGASLQLVLPAAYEDSVEFVTQQLGAPWGERFAKLLACADDISVVTGFVAGEEARALMYARQVASGLSRLRAAQTGASWQAMPEEVVPAATGDTGTWPCISNDLEPLKLQRRQAALIFADMVGFSRLRDDELPAFWNRLMPELARVLSRYAHHVLLQSTWGDALYIVVDAAQPAAAAALDIIAAVTRMRGELPGALAALNLRLSIHYAPVYSGWDPVGQGKLYYGSHVSLAARIEPVTPPGSIYVTEALAAQLTLEGAQQFELSYAGEVELAKRFGKRRMFNLRAAQARRVPAGTIMSPAEDALAESPEHLRGLVIGCSGALLLTDPQKDWVRRKLSERVLPALRERFEPTRATLVMGLAPGADLLFAETVQDWLSAAGIPLLLRSVLPVPPEIMLADWNDKVAGSGAPDIDAETRANWAAMRRVLSQSLSVVNLWPPEADVVDLATRSYRQRQYRRLGAYLVRHCDVLVAIYNRSAAGGPGGTAEVVKWWREAAPAAGVPRALAVLDPVKREVTIEL